MAEQGADPGVWQDVIRSYFIATFLEQEHLALPLVPRLASLRFLITQSVSRVSSISRSGPHVNSDTG